MHRSIAPVMTILFGALINLSLQACRRLELASEWWWRGWRSNQGTDASAPRIVGGRACTWGLRDLSSLCKATMRPHLNSYNTV